MKKIILLLIVCCIGLTAMAQKPTFGIRAGLNISTLGGKNADVIANGSKVGLNAGGFVNLPIGTGFSIQPELSYSQLGAEISTTYIFPGGGSGTIDTWNFDYLTLPILGKYDFTNSGFSLYAGPQIGLLTSAKYEYDDGSKDDVKSLFKKTDFGGILGGEYTFTKIPLGISARYQFGISSIADDKNVDIRNNTSTFSLYYNFK